jgi:pyruvate/2-oxoglutarate/acetoin dehydrogenase E1 component/TPP-dependent pyruvate/acetoin dehydrogenase alpha subunit
MLLSELETSVPAVKKQSHREALEDFWFCLISREASILGRKEVLSGKAKFGIVGDGKEVPQVAMARAFKKGDWRSGYYRDQTFMMALGLCSVEDFFAQLYSDHPNDPFSGGRQMNAHFATKTINESSEWLDHKDLLNVSSDISSTAGQMARALGLALASSKYRESDHLKGNLSENGNEVSFVTIGDASTSEGVFWETVNAAGVLQVPLAIFVWDDGYGISVPKEYQTSKGSISEALSGFQYDSKKKSGIHIHNVHAWDYPSLIKSFSKGIEHTRKNHIPCLFHVDECTQPQGHSTSGSHERYKSKERLAWEKEFDCILKMKSWMISEGISDEETLNKMQEDARIYVKDRAKIAFQRFQTPTKEAIATISGIYQGLEQSPEIVEAIDELKTMIHPSMGEVVGNVRRALIHLGDSKASEISILKSFVKEQTILGDRRVSSFLHLENEGSVHKVPVVSPQFSEMSQTKVGYEVLNANFERLFHQDPSIFAFGEDVGQIGDVNQGFAGLQAIFGKERIFDTGIREWTIIGQAIGMAMRGLRPIAEIQYLDYLVYAMSPLSDDLATLLWRSNGIQIAPAIIRTRGHRLEGIWHAGSPMGLLLNSLRGIYILTPRDMVRAAGFYNTLLKSKEPALVIECLNGYRRKELVPDNLSEFTMPIGQVEILEEGKDVTLLTYGSSVRIAQAAIEILKKHNISVELIDAQSLMPFDIDHKMLESLEKTNRLLILDEDVPGGASAYLLQNILENQNGYKYLDAKPVTLTAKPHRPAYGSDGDYFSKPQIEDVVEAIMKIVKE